MTDLMIFNARLELEEDVAAELEDFALLVRIGIYDEAYRHLDTILWDHLDHYAVFAEVAQFLADRNDMTDRKKAFINTLQLGEVRDHDAASLYACLGMSFASDYPQPFKPSHDFKDVESPAWVSHSVSIIQSEAH